MNGRTYERVNGRTYERVNAKVLPPFLPFTPSPVHPFSPSPVIKFYRINKFYVFLFFVPDKNAYFCKRIEKTSFGNMKRSMIYVKSSKSMIIKIMRVPYDL
jgi:hypothetical protein